MSIYLPYIRPFFLLLLMLIASPSLFSDNSKLLDNKIKVIVVLNDNYNIDKGKNKRNQASNIALSMGLKAKHSFGNVLYGFSTNLSHKRLATLSNDPRIKYIEVDKLQHFPLRPNKTLKAPRCTDNPTGPGCGITPSEESTQQTPWGIERIGLAADNKAEGIHLFIIDTGIDSNHEDLQNLGVGFTTISCQGKGKKSSCREAWDDDNGHGTHVAGTVGAENNAFGVIGVAPEVILHAVKVLDSRGSGYTSGIISGIDKMAAYMADMHVAYVVNMSIGGNGSKSGICSADSYQGKDSYHEAICRATQHGAVFVVAAGNEGVDASTKKPASYDDSSIAVSAIGRVTDSNGNVTGQFGWPSWSNWGNKSTILGHQHNSFPVAISAPGMGILSTWKDNKYETISGTSMASPHVAGAVALYLKAYPNRADYSAFINAREALLLNEEETNNNTFSIRGGFPHTEGFLYINNFH
ncbi:S8 family peptidase [Psychromonas hadalis]|uniref:S8 family peptidase n=1 Tax=Psychromonas hadalis TaxID=211669 RepID=UPI0003B589C5|nr:S8 family serine peptidase [Psychromonas hadalis]